MSVEVALDAPYGRYYKDNQPTVESWMLFLMDGAVPTTPAEVKSRVDLTSFTDLYNKSVATCGSAGSVTSCLRDSGTTVMTITSTPGINSSSTQFKNAVFSYPPSGFPMPKRMSRVDGKTHILSMNRNMLDNLGHNFGDNYSGVTQVRASLSDPAETDFLYEYDNAITFSSLYWHGGNAGMTAISTVAVLYYDEATTTWKTAQSYTLTAANNSSGATFTITTPFTAKKVIVRITALITASFNVRVRLFGTLAANPATLGSVVAPTWGIFIPDYIVNFGASNATYNWLQSLVAGKIANIPAIIDTAGYNDGSRIELNADYTFKRYTFALGGIKS